MKKEKEPFCLKFSTAILLIILLLVVVLGIFYFCFVKKAKENNPISVEEAPMIGENKENKISSNNIPQIEELDINNELVQKLYQFVLKYSDYEETLVYQSQAVTIKTLPNLLKLRTIFENLSSSEADEVTHKTEYGLDITHTLFKKETVEKKAQEIFGDTVTLLHESCPIYFAQAIDYKDGIYDCHSYQGGGQTPWDKSVSKLKSAEQKEDEIYIYDQYIHVYDEVDETSSEEGIYTSSDRKNKISDLINISFINKDQREEEAFSQYEEKLGSKIQTFKHTFKKNANGGYYWYRTEPI